MDFRQNQANSKKLTWGLFVGFVASVAASIFAITWLLNKTTIFFIQISLPPIVLQSIAVMIFMGVLISSLWQLHKFKKGGSVIALLMGAEEVGPGSPSRILMARNTVEEMAIAARIKAPKFFYIEDDAINAFAAGWSESDAIVCVTTGCVDRLTRDEVQGVVAHEVGHIINGDIRLNMYISAAVSGLQSLTNFGLFILTGKAVSSNRMRNVSRSKNESASASVLVFAFGLVFIVCGSISWMIGRVLQAAISRQREYLADATSVELTRNKAGIGRALRKIAHQNKGGVKIHISQNATNICSHLLMAPSDGAAEFLLATHPRIGTRIKRVYGRYLPPLEASYQEEFGNSIKPDEVPTKEDLNQFEFSLNNRKNRDLDDKFNV